MAKPREIVKLQAFLIGVFVVVIVFYFFYFRDIALSLLSGEETPSFWEKIINFFYPRLLVESQRFPATFFVAKADAVLLRFGLVVSFLFAFSQLYNVNRHFNDKWRAFWSQKISLPAFRGISRWMYAGILFYCWNWWADIELWHQLAPLYKGHSFYSFFSLPPEWVLKVSWLLLIGAACWCFFRPSLLPSALASALFIFLHGFFNGFEKVDHGFATFSFVLMLLPFGFLSGKENESISWPLLLAQLMVASAYLFSGLEKLLVSGWHWFEPENLAAHFQLHSSEKTDWLLRFPFLLLALSALLLTWQLSFWSFLFLPKTKALFLLGGLFFHLSTFLVLGIGGFISPWVWVYGIFFKQNSWVIAFGIWEISSPKPFIRLSRRP